MVALVLVCMARSKRRQSKRRQSNRRSVAERSPVKRAAASRRHLQRPSSTSNTPVTSTPPAFAPDGDMADRYYAMAEAMNTRGAMEMAVPFYRQAITLLLAERASLQQKLGGASAQRLPEELPLDDLHGLLEAAESLGQTASAVPAPAATDVRAQTPSPVSAEAQIAELAAELGKENALQVIAGLKAIAEGSGGQLPAAGLALLGKAQMLLGHAADGLQSFEAAMAAAPGDPELQINAGAARLATGDGKGALALLRRVWQQGFESLEPSSQRALLRNLSAAEANAGYLTGALQLRLKWLAMDPKAVPIATWINWARQGLDDKDKSSPVRQAAIALLQGLQRAVPTDRTVLQSLADALEDQGDFREASLLYRQLLRPQQA